MKIRTEKDVELLDQKIKDDLGIDIRKYGNEEVLAAFAEILVFPQYILTWTIRPILLAVFAFFLGFFVLNLVHIEFLIYLLFGFSLFLMVGVFFGVLFFMWKMKKDMWNILNYALDILKNTVQDLSHFQHTIPPAKRRQALGLLFKGILHIILIPGISRIISDKIPFIGWIFIWPIKTVLSLISDRIKWDGHMLNDELEKVDNEEQLIPLYLKTINGVQKGIKTVLDVSFKVFQFPVLIGFFICLSLLIIFIYLIN